MGETSQVAGFSYDHQDDRRTNSANRHEPPPIGVTAKTDAAAGRWCRANDSTPALLKAIRDTQGELLTVGDGSDQPPARASEDLGAFLDGLATAWQEIDPAPRGETTSATKHWWRTRIDPFAYSWPLVEEWLRPESDIPAQALMQRLSEQFPDFYPTGAQLRTLQRRVQLWRNEQVKRLIFQTSDTHLTSSDIPSVDQHSEATTNIER